MVRFDKVTKKYIGDIIAVENVSFSIDQGEFSFIVGPSGAGKSTIIRLLIREEHPTEGEIVFEEINVANLPRELLSPYRQQLGVVFQDLKLINSKSVLENIQFALEITQRDASTIDETARYLLDVVGLSSRSHLFPKELSGGEKQKVAIARALANDPKLFIADEPTGNLDPDTAMEILDILKTINSWGTTVLVVTHDKGIVDKMQTRVIHMNNGKIISDEKGGYFDKGNKQKPKREKVELTKEKMEDSKYDDLLERLDLSNKILKKLSKKNVLDVEDLLNQTEKDLKKLRLSVKEIKEVNKKLENYLSK